MESQSNSSTPVVSDERFTSVGFRCWRAPAYHVRSQPSKSQQATGLLAGFSPVAHKLFTIENAHCSRLFPGFAQVIHKAVVQKKRAPVKGAHWRQPGRFSASELHGFFNAEFLCAATRALAPALRRTLLRSVFLMLALIPARVSSLFLRFHRINGLAGQMSLETDCIARRNVHRMFEVFRTKCPPPKICLVPLERINHPQNTPRSQIRRQTPPRARPGKCVSAGSRPSPPRTECNPGSRNEASTEPKHARKEAGSSHPSIDPRRDREPTEVPIPTIQVRDSRTRTTVAPTNPAECTAARRSTLLARELFQSYGNGRFSIQGQRKRNQRGNQGKSTE